MYFTSTGCVAVTLSLDHDTCAARIPCLQLETNSRARPLPNTVAGKLSQSSDRLCVITSPRFRLNKVETTSLDAFNHLDWNGPTGRSPKQRDLSMSLNICRCCGERMIANSQSNPNICVGCEQLLEDHGAELNAMRTHPALLRFANGWLSQLTGSQERSQVRPAIPQGDGGRADEGGWCGGLKVRLKSFLVPCLEKPQRHLAVGSLQPCPRHSNGIHS